jgi:hypothetical protein
MHDTPSKTTAKQPQESNGPLVTQATPGDAQFSLNDYNGEREQDQAIAQLASQLEDMGEYLWESVIPQDFSEKVKSLPTISHLSYLLSAISLPMAAVGEIRNNSAAGVRHYVQAGNRKIACASKEQAAKVAKDITRSTWRVLEPLRCLYLLNIRLTVSGGHALCDPRSWVTFSCGNQHVAKAVNEEAARDYVRALNQVYLDAIKDARNDILADLLRQAGER